MHPHQPMTFIVPHHFPDGGTSLNISEKFMTALGITTVLMVGVTVFYFPRRIDNVRAETKQMVEAGIDKAMAVATSNRTPAMPDVSPQLAELKATVKSLEREIVSFEAGLAERDRALADLRARVAASEQQSANAVNTANSALTAARNAAVAPAPVPAPPAPVYVQQPAAIAPRPTAIPVGAIVETPAPSAVMATTVENWRFEVKRLTVSDKMASVMMTVTPLEEDCRMKFDAVAFDQAGRELEFFSAILGGRRQLRSSGPVDGNFIAGVPSEVTFTFEGPSSQISAVTSMTIGFSINGRDRRTAKFRNIPLAQ